MTEQEQNIAIAEATGTEHGLVCPSHGLVPYERAVIPKCPWCERGLSQIAPDYTGSLDAMHEAEKTLTQDQQRNYWTHLLTIRAREAVRPATEHSRDTFAFMATAAQRAEAFLRTIGKWTESTPPTP